MTSPSRGSRLGHISKQGNALLRFLLVEAAQVTVRSQPPTALAFELVIGTPGRFHCGKQIASYVGLVPSEESSGNRRAHAGMRHQPPRHRALLHFFFQRSSPFLDLRGELAQYVEQVLASSTGPRSQFQRLQFVASCADRQFHGLDSRR